MEKIHIYHTNDVHSHLKSWPRARTFLQQRKQEHLDRGEACFIFDLGDFIDRADLYTEASLGRENMHLLETAGYDAVTIGNNEGITLSKEALEALYKDVDFDVILSNLKNSDGSQPQWANPYKIYTTEKGLKIGVLGATAPFYEYYEPLGWKIIEPIENMQKIAKEIEKKTDILVCLSHLGITVDEQLANTIDSVDLIIGAHTHHVFENGKRVEQALLTGGGKFGTYIGHSTIEVESSSLANKKIDTELVKLDQLPHIEGETREVEALQLWGKEHLNVEVFKAGRYYNKEWKHDSHLARLFSKALLDYAQADCAFFNAGVFMTPLEKGSVTAYDLHQMLPHPINACLIEMTGEQLIQCLREIQTHSEWPDIEVKGLGFRGRVLGKVLQYDCQLVDGQLFVKGIKKELTDSIQVVTFDMFTFGWFFPELKDMNKKYLLPHFLRDILAIYGYKYFGK